MNTNEPQTKQISKTTVFYARVKTDTKNNTTSIKI